MSTIDPRLLPGLTLPGTSTTTLSASTAPRISGTPIFVDISTSPLKSNIVREGFQVPPARIDETTVRSVLDRLEPIRPMAAARVVRQSVPPGTRVAPGGAVDLVLAPREAIPIEIFADVHAELRQRSVAEVASVLDNSTVRMAVLRATSTDQLTAAEREAVSSQAAQQLGITIDDAVPEQSFERVFSTLRSAAAFR